MRSRFLLIFGLLATLGCNNDFVTTPGTDFPNLVTGIYITPETSFAPIDVWGNPVRFNSSSNSFVFDNPYPNPSDGRFTIQLRLPTAANVSLWMESAYWPNDGLLPHQSYSTNPTQAVVFMNERRMTAVIHSVDTNLYSICEGGDLYPGFYRIYFKASSFLAWRGVYIAGPSGTNPPGLVSERNESSNCEL